jgi:hypothetical protein
MNENALILLLPHYLSNILRKYDPKTELFVLTRGKVSRETMVRIIPSIGKFLPPPVSPKIT